MKRLKTAVRIALSIVLLGYLLYVVDLEQAGGLLRRGRPLYILAALGVALFDRWLMAYKWVILLRVKRISLTVRQATEVYWTSTFLGVFLPATVGGDALRFLAVWRRGFPSRDVIASIMVERFLGFMALFAFLALSIFLNLTLSPSLLPETVWRPLWLIALGSIALIGLFVLTMHPKLARVFAAYSARVNQRVAALLAKARSFYQAYLEYRTHPGALFHFLVLSLFENLLPLTWTYLLAQAFSIHIPFLYYFLLIPIVLVLVRLPISVDGFGVQEGAFVYLLSLVGVPASDAFFLGLTSHLLALVSVLPGGILYALGGLEGYGDSRVTVRPEGS